MKKFLTIFTVVALILAITAVFVSCGDNNNKDTETKAVTTTESVVSSSDESDSEEQSDERYHDGVPDDTVDDISWIK